MLPLMELPDTSSGMSESLFCLQSAPNDNPSKHWGGHSADRKSKPIVGDSS